MSQFSGSADFLYSVGADTRQLDAAMKDTSRKAEGAFGRVGTSIEKSTSGARKFSGALSSTVGIATGLLGVIGFAVGAATSLYLVWDNIANAAERAEAKARAQANEVRRMATELRGMGGDSRGLFSMDEDIIAIQDRARQIRQQLRDSGAGGSTLFDQLNEIDLAEQQAINRVYFERSAQLTDIVDSTRLQIEQDQLRRNGMDAEADALQRQAEHRERIEKLSIAQQNAVNNGFEMQSRQLLSLIELENERFRAAEAYHAEQLRIAELQKQQDLQDRAGGFRENLIDALLRAEGRDDLADSERSIQERNRRMRELDSLLESGAISSDEFLNMERLIDRLFDLRQAELFGQEQEPQRLRFGASVAGNVGSGVGAQVLGGTGNITQQMDQKRNATLTSMDKTTKDILTAVRESTSVARFA